MLDRIPVGELEDYHNFRLKKYNHLYYCKKCQRNFETAKKTEKCKFCNSPARELERKEIFLPEKKKFRYYCTKCEKNFTLDEKVEICQICGHKFIHYYPWTRLRTREKVIVKMLGWAKVLNSIRYQFKHQKENVKKEPVAKNKFNFSAKIRLPEVKIKMPKPKIRIKARRHVFFSRRMEEMPSR